MSALLLALNLVVCGKLFGVEYLNQLGSIEGSFIAISRYAIDHFPNLKWWPLWFTGMPYHSVYGPALPHLVALLAVVLKISPALAFHKTVALFYCLGPVTFFWMATRLSSSIAVGFWSGLLYSVISPAAILIPAIARDIGGMWHLRRLYNLIAYGESPHIAALALMPLAMVAIDAAIRRGRIGHFVLAAISIAAVALTNVTGTVGLAILVVAYFLSAPSRIALARIAIIAALAYALVIPWLPPSTIRLILANSQHSLGTTYPIRFLPIIAIVALAAICSRLPFNTFLRFAFLTTAIAAMIVLPAFLWNINIVPQPERFQLEFEMGFCLLVALGIARLRYRAVIASLCLAALISDYRFATRLIQPIDIRKTIEYQEAKWFDQNMGGRRVFAPGSISFWMNVFTDTPQLGGCCDQSVPNFEQRVALYTLYSGQNLGPREAEISLLWLQAYGVHAVGVSRKGSREFYKPFANPDKFEGVLFVLWENDSDVVYRVPLYSDSLAHVITESQRITRAPTDGSDVAPLLPYVAAINDPQAPRADLQWTTSSRGTIDAELRPGDLVSVQITYDPGWRAVVNGHQRPIDSDGLGMMILRPDCSGHCTVELNYDGGLFRTAYR